MSNNCVIPIAPSTQAYLTVKRDYAQDKFDITKFVFDFQNVPAPSILDNIWCYLKCEEASGQNRLDSTPNGHNTIAYGTTAQISGKVANGINFKIDGNGYPRLLFQGGANALNFVGDPNFSMAFWLRVSNATHSPYVLIPFTIDSDTYEVRLLATAANATDPTCDLWVTFGQLIAAGAHTLSADTWHFVVVTYDGNGLNVYVNNNSYASDVGSANHSSNSATLQYIGWPDDSVSSTDLDEFGIWMRALSANDIAYLWNNGTGRTLY